MNIQRVSKILLLLSLFLGSACQEKTDSAGIVVVAMDDGITLFGKRVELDNLKATLLDSLVKMSTIPEDIAITFQGEVLMGIRGEVETEVNQAIAAAKEARLNPVVVSRTFWMEKGTDCDQPDSLRNNCAVINLVYPVVYFKENAIRNSIETWTTHYLTRILAGGGEEDGSTSATPTLDAAANVFFNNHEEFKGSAMYGAFIAECTNDVLLNDGKHLTLELNGYTFQGGAHGSPTAAVATFDTNTGRQLSWDDLVTDKEALQKLAEKKFREVRAEDFKEGFEFDEIFPFKLPDNYGLTDEGIYFHYLPYEVGPYAMGETIFTLPFSEIGALFKLTTKN